MKICFVRYDRLGDFLLTVPVDYSHRKQFPNEEITWLVSESVDFLARNLNPPIHYETIPVPKTIADRFRAAFKIYSWARQQKFSKVVVFHGPWWLAFGFYMARVPQRVGVASQWYSWLFYNSRIRQRRSLGDKHELEYNYDLANFAFGVSKPDGINETEGYIKISTTLKLKWREITENWGPFIVLHPGMMGSARNFAPGSYKKLAEKLLATGVKLVITGGPSDEKFVDQTEVLKLSGVINMVGKTAGEEILGLLNFAKAVIAPSTGVIHIASAIGIPVIGIYSPVRVQAPKRWSPIGKNVSIYKPEINCPGTLSCIGKECLEFDCMDKISLNSITDSVRTILKV